MTLELFTANFTARASRVHERRHRVVRVQPVQEPNRLGDAREQEKRDYRGGNQNPFIVNR
jgi:hypothetical protein